MQQPGAALLRLEKVMDANNVYEQHEADKTKGRKSLDDA